MGEKVEIIAKFNNALINHELALKAEDRENILERISQNTSVCVGFYKDHELSFLAIFDVESQDDCLHVNYVSGNFGKRYKYLDLFSTALAKLLKLSFVTFKTKRKAVKKWAESAGYVFNEDFNDYQKAI